MGLEGGAPRPGYSLLTHEMGGWTTCDFMFFFFFFFFLILFQSYQDDGKKIIIKLCATGPLLDLTCTCITCTK